MGTFSAHEDFGMGTWHRVASVADLRDDEGLDA
jgi:hypothetical protein